MLDTTRISSKGQVVISKRVRGDMIVIRKLTLEDLVTESLENHRRGKTLSHEETFEDLL